MIRTGLALTYLMPLRASELFTAKNGVFHEVYWLGRRDVTFFRGGRQL